MYGAKYLKWYSRGLPDLPGDAERRGLEHAGARVVPEQHVGDGIAREVAAER